MVTTSRDDYQAESRGWSIRNGDLSEEAVRLRALLPVVLRRYGLAVGPSAAAEIQDDDPSLASKPDENRCAFIEARSSWTYSI